MDIFKKCPLEGDRSVLSFLILLCILNSVVNCGVHELISPPLFLSYLTYFMDVSFPGLFSPLIRQVMKKLTVQISKSTVIYIVFFVSRVL